MKADINDMMKYKEKQNKIRKRMSSYKEQYNVLQNLFYEKKLELQFVKHDQ